MAAWLCEALFLANCITAYSFNYGIMQLGSPSFNPSSSIRQSVSLDLVRSRLSNSRPGVLTPSFEVDSRLVFNRVIINNNFDWTEIKDNIDSQFSAPNTQIFKVDYKGKDESYFADQIVKYRVLPIMENAKVYSKLAIYLTFFPFY